jgi:hypothetical protein
VNTLRYEVLHFRLEAAAEEQRRREVAFQFATASIGLEGFAMSAEVQARAKRFITGEIDLAEFIQAR